MFKKEWLQMFIFAGLSCLTIFWFVNWNDNVRPSQMGMLDAEAMSEKFLTDEESPQIESMDDSNTPQDRNSRIRSYMIAGGIQEHKVDLIISKSEQYDIDPLLIFAICRQESGFNQSTISSAGAIGIMQLMPETAKWLDVDPYDMEQNLDGGIRYIKQALSDRGGDLSMALSDYNAGVNATNKYGFVPPYDETEQYVLKIRHSLDRYIRDIDG